VSPPRDKIRPLDPIRCKAPDCEFVTAMEFAALQHEDLPGHRMEWWEEKEERLSRERQARQASGV
jgi:hypothetical protein